MNRDLGWHGLAGLLEHVPVNDAVKQDLVDRMSGTDRFYHGIGHLALLWQRHQRHAGESGLGGPTATKLIAGAIAFHDAIYEVGRDDNESRSAQYWMDASRATLWTERDRLWVYDTILATRDHLSYSPSASADADLDASSSATREHARIWVLDLDLTPLGEDIVVFEENTRLLRREAGHLTYQAWDQARLRYLKSFIDAPKIYRSPVLAAVFEGPARQNLERQFALP